jgi:hypothetical protein
MPQIQWSIWSQSQRQQKDFKLTDQHVNEVSTVCARGLDGWLHWFTKRIVVLSMMVANERVLHQDLGEVERDPDMNGTVISSIGSHGFEEKFSLVKIQIVGIQQSMDLDLELEPECWGSFWVSRRRRSQRQWQIRVPWSLQRTEEPYDGHFSSHNPAFHGFASLLGFLSIETGNTKGGSITVLLTSCLTGLESAVWQLTILVFICKTD